MLREEDAVRVIGPARTGPTNIIGSESLAKSTLRMCSPDVLNEAAHAAILPPVGTFATTDS